MLTGRLIHRAVLSIVIIAGVGLAAEVFGADKAGDKPAARMPEPPIPLPASLTPASPEAPPLPVEGLEPAAPRCRVKTSFCRARTLPLPRRRRTPSTQRLPTPGIAITAIIRTRAKRGKRSSRSAAAR